MMRDWTIPVLDECIFLSYGCFLVKAGLKTSERGLRGALQGVMFGVTSHTSGESMIVCFWIIVSTCPSEQISRNQKTQQGVSK